MLQTQLGIPYEDAVAKLPELERIASLNPDNYEDIQNYGAHLFAVGRTEDSIVEFDKALKLRPDSSNVMLNLGMAYKEQGNFDAADYYIEESFKHESEFWYGRLAWAESLLRRGRWAEAWPLYEKARFTKKSTRDSSNVPSALPLWTPEVKTGLQDSPDGKQYPMCVYIMGEGGWGDRINYSRYLPEMAKLNIPFLHNIDCGSMGSMLASIFERQGFLGTRLEVGMPVCFTHWNTTFGLPSAFKATTETLPFWPKPWVADPGIEERFRTIRRPGNLNVGLVWNAGEAFEGKRKFRSLTEWQAARLVLETQDRINWVNLQYGWNIPHAPMASLPEFKTWEHTMAGMANCDAVISVDTGPMHLAGAMAKPLVVVLPGNSDWKFLLNRDDCPWYPSARILRNGQEAGFEKVLPVLIQWIKAGGLDYWVKNQYAPKEVGNVANA